MVEWIVLEVLVYAVLGSNPLIGKKFFSAGQSPRGAAEGGDSPAELRGGVRGILKTPEEQILIQQF